MIHVRDRQHHAAACRVAPELGDGKAARCDSECPTAVAIRTLDAERRDAVSTCEKCWSDAGLAEFLTGADHTTDYRRLIAERVGALACTPEQQAGPDATKCAACGHVRGSRTAHQHTGECMACHRENRPSAFRVGARVVYRPAHGPAEEGTVTSVNEAFVFVCYGLPGSASKATAPTDLERVGQKVAP